jgi:hypothetical protein
MKAYFLINLMGPAHTNSAEKNILKTLHTKLLGPYKLGITNTPMTY